MKRLNMFANILLCAAFGLWAVRALLFYVNYTRHAALFAAEGWLWYTDVLTWGKYILPVAAACLAIKLILRRK